MTGTSARLRQLRVAKARLAASFVVLDLDWLPLSAPLLCRRLGYCGEPARAALAAPGAACGINATLAGLGARERGEALELLNIAALRPDDLSISAGVHEWKVAGPSGPATHAYVCTDAQVGTRCRL